MRILDRYINKSIITIFFSTVFVFLFLYVLIDSTSNLDEIIDRKVPFDILIKYYLSFFPIILAQTSSVACLISILFTFSQLNNNNEVIAMRASGLTFWSIARPAIIFGLLISVTVFWVNERFVPQATILTERIQDESMSSKSNNKSKKLDLIENLTFYGLRNRLYFIDKFDPNTNELSGITIVEYDENQNIKQKIVAFKGQWSGIAWNFIKSQVTSFDTEFANRPVKVKVYDEKLMDIKETPKDFLKQRLNVDAMNIRELHSYISRFSNSGAIKALNNLRVDFHQKIAFPFGNFVIILLGLPFALMIKNRKGTTFTSLGIAIIIGFLFYVSNAVCIAFGKGGLLPPILAAWCAPIIFTGVAIYIIEKNFG